MRRAGCDAYGLNCRAFYRANFSGPGMNHLDQLDDYYAIMFHV